MARKPDIAAGAVLIRAIKPEKGIKTMQKNRGDVNFKNLTNGPAKITQALKITKQHYGIDLTKDPRLCISEGIKIDDITASPRVGISQATEKLWNFKTRI